MGGGGGITGTGGGGGGRGGGHGGGGVSGARGSGGERDDTRVGFVLVTVVFVIVIYLFGV